MAKLIRDYQLDSYYNDDNTTRVSKRRRIKKIKDLDEQNTKIIKKD